MAKRKSGVHVPDQGAAPAPPHQVEVSKKSAVPLIFVSHDHRDAPLGEAFSNLLTDASGGFLKSFLSSGQKGVGIPYGEEWYPEIMKKISDARDVVALLTPTSVGRPWILYEAGVAKGKLDKRVFGVVIGMPMQNAIQGPFNQFQNCAGDENTLTDLVLQLIRRNSDNDPREEAVRRQVKAFLENVAKIPSARVDSTRAPKDVEANAVAQLFEEIKVMFRDLPDRLQGQLAETLGPRLSRRRRMHPEMMFEMMHVFEEMEDRAFGWLMLISTFRDDLPWLYELGVEVYQAVRSGKRERVGIALEHFERCLSSLRHSRMARHFFEHPEMDMLVHELPHVAKHFLLAAPEPPPRGKVRAPPEERSGKS